MNTQSSINKYFKSKDVFSAFTKYTYIFHSPGLEPWILGAIRQSGTHNILDAGCGYGLWGFLLKAICPTYYVCGFDIDLNRLIHARKVYDDVFLADVRHIPLRSKSFDAVIALEVVHGLNADTLEHVLEKLKSLAEKLVLVTDPALNNAKKQVFLKKGFKLYRYLLRGLILLSKSNVFCIYGTRFFKVFKICLRILSPLLDRLLGKGYYLAV